MTTESTDARKPFRVSAPGRVCLFGEHQDFLGLAVIAMAIDRRMTIEARPRPDSAFRVLMPDIRSERTLDPTKDIEYTRPRQYLESGINVARQEGARFDGGWEFTIRSDIPINAGCSSSSAMVVAWIATLLHIAGDPRAEQPMEIARLAHRAEVVEFKEPGGMMDHYTCSLGGLLHIDCADPITVTPLDADLPGLVLGHSGGKKDTTGILAHTRGDVEAGVAALRRQWPEFSLRTATMAQTEPHLADLPENQREKVLANLVNRDICREALAEFQSDADPARVGDLLTRHHAELRDRMHTSTPKLDAMIDAAIAAGALGGKLNGSGGGGTMMALAPGEVAEVVSAIQNTGAEAWPVQKASGVHVEVLH